MYSVQLQFAATEPINDQWRQKTCVIPNSAFLSKKWCSTLVFDEPANEPLSAPIKLPATLQRQPGNGEYSGHSTCCCCMYCLRETICKSHIHRPAAQQLGAGCCTSHVCAFAEPMQMSNEWSTLLGVILHSGGWTAAINRKGTCSIIVWWTKVWFAHSQFFRLRASRG